MRIGVADYGMNVWDGGLYDIEERLRSLQALGYEGIERLEAVSADDAMNKAGLYRKLGMAFSTCRGPQISASIEWTAALGKGYVWTHSSATDFDVFCRQVNRQVAVCANWGIAVGLHNHLGSTVETQAQLELFLARCPQCRLLLDTGHLAAAGGDPIAIIHQFAHRLVAVHVKDWVATNPSATRWTERGYFSALGSGNIGQDNGAVMRALVAAGYDGWVFVEQDNHRQDPLIDLAQSRQYLRDAGF